MPDAISMPNLPRLLLSSLDFKKAVTHKQESEFSY
jgi:hypothetical protein